MRIVDHDVGVIVIARESTMTAVNGGEGDGDDGNGDDQDDDVVRHGGVLGAELGKPSTSGEDN